MRITPWEDLQEMFENYIYDLNGTNKFMTDFDKKIIKYKDSQDPHYHLYVAISIFKEKLKDKLKESKDLESFVKHLLNEVYLVYIKTTSFTSVYRLFNVLNTRGLPLNTSDLLKSENIGEIESKSMRLKYAEDWRQIENNLGREIRKFNSIHKDYTNKRESQNEYIR